MLSSVRMRGNHLCLPCPGSILNLSCLNRRFKLQGMTTQHVIRRIGLAFRSEIRVVQSLAGPHLTFLLGPSHNILHTHYSLLLSKYINGARGGRRIALHCSLYIFQSSNYTAHFILSSWAWASLGTGDLPDIPRLPEEFLACLALCP